MHVFYNFVRYFELTKNPPSPESLVEARVYDTVYTESSAWRLYVHGAMVIEPMAILSESTFLTCLCYAAIEKNAAK